MTDFETAQQASNVPFVVWASPFVFNLWFFLFVLLCTEFKQYFLQIPTRLHYETGAWII